MGDDKPRFTLDIGVRYASDRGLFGLRVDYGSVIAHHQNNNEQVKLHGVPDGVSVRELVANSPAAAAFKTVSPPALYMASSKACPFAGGLPTAKMATALPPLTEQEM